MTQRFGIFSPAMGVREDIPSILLPKVWHEDNSNIEIRHGENRFARLRSAELMEEEYTTGTITVVNGSATVTGDATAWYGSATNYPAWGEDDITSNIGRTITIESVDYEIKSVDSATQITLKIVYAGANDNGLSYVIGTSFAKVPVPDGNPILRYHLQPIGSPAVEYLFAFTKDNVYLWSNTWSAWILKYNCTECTQWDTCNYEAQNVMIATNNVDKVLEWGDSTNSPVTGLLSVLDDANGIEYSAGVYVTKAKFVTSYENYLILGYVTEDGTTYPHRIRWCDLSLYETWDSGDAGTAAVQGKGDINGFGHHRGLLWIFKKDLQGGSIQKFWLVAGDDIFWMDEYSPNIGCLAPESIINDKYGMLYFLATDYTIKNIEMENISQGIDKTMKMIEPDLTPYVKGRYMPEMDKLNWSVPYGAGATANNKVLAYYPEHKIWCFIDIPVTAFGCRTRSSDMTINSMPWETINAWPWEIINTVESKSGFVPEICGDASGYTYEIHGAYTDDGSSYTAYFTISTDFADKQGLHVFKRWLWNHVYVRNEGSGTMTFEVKRDSDSSYQSSGSISLDGDGDILVVDYPCDHRSKHYLLKCSASNPFAFLGMIPEYEIDGMY